MTKSGLTAAQLEQLLAKLRMIVAMPSEQAIEQLDAAVAEFVRVTVVFGDGDGGDGDADDGDVDDDLVRDDVSGDDSKDSGAAIDLRWRRERTEERIEQLRLDIDRVRAATASLNFERLWEAEGLRSAIQDLARYLRPAMEAEFASPIALLRRDALAAADAAEIGAAESRIHEAAGHILHSSSSVRSVVRTIDQACEMLEAKASMNDELQVLARTGKERAARYRAQRKLDEAEVVAAGGNTPKAARLRREAAVLLAQDWAQIFPGESPPASSG